MTFGVLAFLQGHATRLLCSRAVPAEVDVPVGEALEIQFMHRLDVAISRVANLGQLPHQRHPNGQAQAALAKQLVRLWLRKVIDDQQMEMFDDAALELLAFAQSNDGIAGAIEHGVDYLECVPRDFRSPKLAKSWDQRVAAITLRTERP